MDFKWDGYDRYILWLHSLPKEEVCYVRVKYKPEYYEGKEETLKWNPKCNVAGFWREDDAQNITLVWWRWIESFYIFVS